MCVCCIILIILMSYPATFGGACLEFPNVWERIGEKMLYKHLLHSSWEIEGMCQLDNSDRPS